MKKEPLVLLGGGGHCKAAIDVIEAENRFEIIGILDLKERLGSEVCGYKVVGTDDEIEKWHKMGSSFHITLGQIKNAEIRKYLYSKLKALNAILPVICSPNAYISKHAFADEGTILMHHAILNAGATVGVNCIINNKALIEHDTVIGDHCHISTSVVINGNCKVGEASFVGSNSVLIQGIELGKECVVGAGSVIIHDCQSGTIIAGNPGKIIRKK